MIGFANQEEWYVEYIIASVDRGQLQRYLSVSEVDRLSAEDLADIASIMKEELHEMGFYEQMAFVARCKLAEKQGRPNGGT